MINEKRFKEFLSLFQYADEDKKKNESISYIISIMNKAEQEKKILTFDKMAEDEFIPNPLLDRYGTLYFDTRRLYEVFDDYERKTRYIKTEMALTCRELYLDFQNIIEHPLLDEDTSDDEYLK